MSPLSVGDPAPGFSVPSSASTVAQSSSFEGQRHLLFFFGSSSIDHVNAVLRDFCTRWQQFEQYNLTFSGVSIDPNDLHLKEFIETAAHGRILWDFDRTVSSQYGVWQSMAEEGVRAHFRYKLTTFLIDENQRILGVFPFEEPLLHVEQVLSVASPVAITQPCGMAERQAPVLLIPNVLDQTWCQRLMDLYTADGGKESGFMKPTGDQIAEVVDHQFKRRRDRLISEPDLLHQLNELIWRRVKPEIEKAFQFRMAHAERYVVACYDSKQQGFFKPHRDNVLKGTTHRRFAMSLNLNTDDYDGGYLRFLEYGAQFYSPKKGEAIVFSCSLLHEAMPVTRGQRFALLTFFYGDEDVKLREQDQQHIIFNHVLPGQAARHNAIRSPSEQTCSTSGNAPIGFQSERKKKRR